MAPLAERLAHALARLDALVDWERRDRKDLRQGLAPMQDLAQRLGHPERAFRVVHVAGTKGKGSTVALISAGLERAGLRVGSTTSPHVERVHERVRIGQREVSDELLALGLEAALGAREAGLAEDAPAGRASWFDVLTAAALWILAHERVDWAVVEVGIGGRLDSTNVVSGEVCVVTNVDLEHTEVLGTTRAAIAREKAGIVDPGATLVAGMPPDPSLAPEDDAGRVLVEVAAERGAIVRHPEWIRPGERLPVTARNLALARAALDALGERGHTDASGRPLSGDLLDAATREAARLPGRLERLPGHPPVVLDGAHVASSISLALDELAADPALARPPVVVLALARDKDASAILKALGGRVDRVLCTSADRDRHRRPEELAELARRTGLPATAVADPKRAVARALSADPPACWVLVTGSLWLAGAVRAELRSARRSERPAC